jgi:two-component sensor histidine kinase
VSIGLIVAELVSNAFKRVFVGDAAAGPVAAAYEAAETRWRLVVSNNGVGTSEGQLDSDKPAARHLALDVLNTQGERAGPGCLNSFSASISGASAGVRLPSGEAAA